MHSQRPRPPKTWLMLVALAAFATITAGAGASNNTQAPPRLDEPRVTESVVSDVSRPLSELVAEARASRSAAPAAPSTGNKAGRGADSVPSVEPADWKPFSFVAGTASLQPKASFVTLSAAAIPATIANFEGVSNQDNFNLFGFRVNPPDPVGDVGKNHYVEMVNLAFSVFDKQGNLLVGPAKLSSLWAGFAIPDCEDESGDPIVLYDQFDDRWILSQFTTVGPQYWDCVAISTTGDPTGSYYRYAFITQPDPDLAGGTVFPDYPKYGVWKDSYILTTRDFGDIAEYGISVYALEKKKMLKGKPARAVQFYLDSDVVPLELIGDGLLPPDVDGKHEPKESDPIPIVGTQDDNASYGATFDALNIWNMYVKWTGKEPKASIELAAQLPVAAFDSIFPCGVVPGSAAPSSRDCLPQPGVTDGSRFLDILSYRQRPTYRLAYRTDKDEATMVTAQSVEAAPGVAGMRWYEIRRDKKDVYSVAQQGTYAPGDGVHRWMGSVAMDKKGNIAMGYSVVDGTSVFPGIRYTARLESDPPGTMGSLGEGTIVDGTGVQLTVNSRWGDYTSMNVDPADDCTFWYVNEYYTAAGQASSLAGWQTRIASFKLPGCAKGD